MQTIAYKHHLLVIKMLSVKQIAFSYEYQECLRFHFILHP